MSFPIGDWEFWVVTAAFLAAMLWIGRGLLPGSKSRRRKRGHRATLTMGGKAIGKE